MITSSKIFFPTSSISSLPSIIVPQLISMSSIIFSYIVVLVDSFKLGAGLHPKQEPRPVVKHITFAPDAT